MTDQELEALATVRHDEELRRVSLGAALNCTPLDAPDFLKVVLTRAIAFHAFVTNEIPAAPRGRVLH